jgi:hypothetical protein
VAWRVGFVTRAEAESGRVALVAELKAGTYTEPSAVALEEMVTGGWWMLLLGPVEAIYRSLI